MFKQISYLGNWHHTLFAHIQQGEEQYRDSFLPSTTTAMPTTAATDILTTTEAPTTTEIPTTPTTAAISTTTTIGNENDNITAINFELVLLNLSLELHLLRLHYTKFKKRGLGEGEQRFSLPPLQTAPTRLSYPSFLQGKENLKTMGSLWCVLQRNWWEPSKWWWPIFCDRGVGNKFWLVRQDPHPPPPQSIHFQLYRFTLVKNINLSN